MIITLTGSNSFATRQALGLTTKQFSTKYGSDSIEKIDGSEGLESNRLPDLLIGTTLFATNRLIVMRHMAQNKVAWERLGDWLSRVSDDITLIVIEPALDKRTKTFKLLKKISDFREYPELSERELVGWLQKTALELGGKLDAAASRYLVQRIGVEQERLWQELQKLVSYDPQISKATIDELVEPNLQANVFELLDYALGGKPDQAQAVMAKIRVNEDPYKLFGLLVSQVYTLAVIDSARSKNAETIAAETGLHPFVIRKTQAFKTQPGRVRQLIGLVAELDTRLKSSATDPWLLLEQCLNRIAYKTSD